MRPLLSLLSLVAACGLHAQDWDVYLRGRLTDASTGAPIPFGEVHVTDRLDPDLLASARCEIDGRFTRELYTSWVTEGGQYVVAFTAKGYGTRTAMIDVSDVLKADAATAWEIDMEVALRPASGNGRSTEPPLGTCRWSTDEGTLRWVESRAQRAYPIREYREERIAAHEDRIDSVYALGGIMVEGNVTEQWTDAPLRDVEVRVRSASDGTMDKVQRTDGYGYYVMALPYGKTYIVEFVREGLVGKRVQVDTSVPEARTDTTTGFRAGLDIRLFAPPEGEDLSFLDEPIGRMHYAPMENQMVWDMEYSRPRLEKLDALLERHRPK